ncbi:MAG TPA: hypothetical protein VNC50_16270 [Planctomycetia bacterium]|nr:hypothetical protein [Planctomycetia bacterium]
MNGRTRPAARGVLAPLRHSAPAVRRVAATAARNVLRAARPYRTRGQRIAAVRQNPARHRSVLLPDRVLRTEARAAYQRVYGTRPVEVHHRVPLEWRFLFPLADPNRLANLQGLATLDHRRKASDMWDAFRNAHRRAGTEPTAAQVLAHAGLVDRSLLLPYPL